MSLGVTDRYSEKQCIQLILRNMLETVPEPWRYSRYDVSVFIAVSRYSTDTAESCCIDIHPCVHVWVTVSDVSCCIASEAGVKLSVKVMVIMR